MQLTAVLATSALLAASALAKQPAHFVYTFDPVTAGGVSGTIDVQYAKANATTTATITAALDFSGVDMAAVRASDANCVGDVTAYKWHIHTLWGAATASASFAQCAKALTSNHYDPLLACGPNSEYAGTDKCPAATVAAYSCSPASYAANPLACEKGDLSGKFGAITLDAATKKAAGSWVDTSYPTVEENTPTWNMMLHAVCGSATPRIACATAVMAGDNDDSDSDDDSHAHC